MKFIVTLLSILALLPFEALSTAVGVSADRAPPSPEHLLEVIQLKLDEAFVEAADQVEQLKTELLHLRQSVEHLTWVTNRAEGVVQQVALNNDVLVRNVTMLASQNDNIVLNQQYCANHEALKNLFSDRTPKCLEGQTPLAPALPWTSTTVAATTSTTAAASTSTTEVDTTIEVDTTTTSAVEERIFARCSDAPSQSGVYRLQRPDGVTFRAFCEQERFGGGLLVFQSRRDGSVNFNRSWADFVEGFGDPAGEHWLGLETLHQLTVRTAPELVIAMRNFSNVEAYESYPNFWVDPLNVHYPIRLNTTGSGSAGDSLFPYYNEYFMTYDHIPNTAHQNCISMLGSGFWHYACGTSNTRNNLNGVYGLGRGIQGIWWGTFGNLTVQNNSPLKTVQMMIRY